VTAGREKFKQHCATCHTHGNDFDNKTPTASDLADFATADWNLRLITNPGNKDFFGRTKLITMKESIEEKYPNLALSREEEAKLAPDDKDALEKDRKDLKVIADWLAQHPRRTSEDRDGESFKNGLKTFRGQGCNGCHVYVGEGGTRKGRGPDLTGYGDPKWVRKMIMAPFDPSRYGSRNRMPAFRDMEGMFGDEIKEELQRSKNQLLEKVDANDPEKRRQIDDAHTLIQLSDVDRELIIRYLLKDYRVVFGGEPIAAPPRH
jgi:mono/diheme cytochrome c family protein